jgi:hypothetical protein
VSDWCFKAKREMFQQYHDKNKLDFNDMMMMAVLFLTKMTKWIFIVLVLTHWNRSTDRHVDPRRSSKYQSNSAWIDLMVIEPMIYWTRDELTNHYSTELVWQFQNVIIWKTTCLKANKGPPSHFQKKWYPQTVFTVISS